MKWPTLAVLFLAVPALLLLINLTGFMPYMPTPDPQQWNIQYTPVVALSLGAAIFGFLAWKRQHAGKLLMASIIWNVAWCGLGLAAVITLWGEKV